MNIIVTILASLVMLLALRFSLERDKHERLSPQPIILWPVLLAGLIIAAPIVALLAVVNAINNYPGGLGG